jgi:hypothetical protein
VDHGKKSGRFLGIGSVDGPADLGNVRRCVSEHAERSLDQIDESALLGLLAFAVESIDDEERVFAARAWSTRPA